MRKVLSVLFIVSLAFLFVSCTNEHTYTQEEYDEAVQEAKDEGYTEGHKDGEQDGYEEGYAQAEQDFQANELPEKPVDIEGMVYITDTGEKYHRAGCSSLNESYHAIAIEKAQALGYDACDRCNPPTQDATVFVNEGGKKYHVANCTYVDKDSEAVTIDNAQQRGFGPCPVCNPPA